MQFLRKIINNNNFLANTAIAAKKAVRTLYNRISYKTLTFCTYYRLNRLLTECIWLGLDVNAKDVHDNTPLHAAVQYSNTAAIEILIANKADVNAVNQQHFTALHVAILSWSPLHLVKIIRMFITAGADPNIADIYGDTPLASLSCRFETNLAEARVALIQAGAVPKAQNLANKTTIELAMDYDNAEAFKAYVKAGLNLATASIDGLPLLEWAMRHSKKAVARILIRAVDVNASSSSDGRTALHLAAMQGDWETACALIKAGAEIYAVDNDNHTAFYYAAQHYQAQMQLAGKIELAKNYLKVCVALMNDGDPTDYAQIDTVDINKFIVHPQRYFTLLHYAASTCDDPVFVNELLNLDFSVPTDVEYNYRNKTIDVAATPARFIPDKYGKIPLHSAIEHNKTAAALALISTKDSVYTVSHTDDKHKPPVFKAIETGNLEIFHALIAAGAIDEAFHNYGGNTALIYAIKKGQREMALSLIPTSDLTVLDDSRLPALYYAALNNDYELMQALIAAGATIHRHSGHVNNFSDPETYRYDTLLHYVAEHTTDPNLLSTLLRVCSKEDIMARDDYLRTCLHAAAKNLTCNTAEILIEQGAAVDFIDAYKLTALHTAAKYNNCAAATSIIKASKSALSIKDSFGMNALHIAATLLKSEVFKVFLDAGSDPNSRDNSDFTVLHTAILNDAIDIISLLLSADVDITAACDYKTALMLAVSTGKIEIVKMILEHKQAKAKPLDEINFYGKGLMHHAKDPAIIHMLTNDFKIKIDPTDNDNNTPLNIAANIVVSGRYSDTDKKLIKTLLMYGASLGAPYKNPRPNSQSERQQPDGQAPTDALQRFNASYKRDFQGTLFYMAHKIFNQATYTLPDGNKVASFNRIGADNIKRILAYWLGESEFVKPVTQKILAQHAPAQKREGAASKHAAT